MSNTQQVFSEFQTYGRQYHPEIQVEIIEKPEISDTSILYLFLYYRHEQLPVPRCKLQVNFSMSNQQVILELPGLYRSPLKYTSAQCVFERLLSLMNAMIPPSINKGTNKKISKQTKDSISITPQDSPIDHCNFLKTPFSFEEISPFCPYLVRCSSSISNSPKSSSMSNIIDRPSYIGQFNLTITRPSIATPIVRHSQESEVGSIHPKFLLNAEHSAEFKLGDLPEVLKNAFIGSGEIRMEKEIIYSSVSSIFKVLTNIISLYPSINGQNVYDVYRFILFVLVDVNKVSTSQIIPIVNLTKGINITYMEDTGLFESLYSNDKIFKIDEIIKSFVSYIEKLSKEREYFDESGDMTGTSSSSSDVRSFAMSSPTSRLTNYVMDNNESQSQCSDDLSVNLFIQDILTRYPEFLNQSIFQIEVDYIASVVSDYFTQICLKKSRDPFVDLQKNEVIDHITIEKSLTDTLQVFAMSKIHLLSYLLSCLCPTYCSINEILLIFYLLPIQSMRFIFTYEVSSGSNERRHKTRKNIDVSRDIYGGDKKNATSFDDIYSDVAQYQIFHPVLSSPKDAYNLLCNTSGVYSGLRLWTYTMHENTKDKTSDELNKYSLPSGFLDHKPLPQSINAQNDNTTVSIDESLISQLFRPNCEHIIMDLCLFLPVAINLSRLYILDQHIKYLSEDGIYGFCVSSFRRFGGVLVDGYDISVKKRSGAAFSSNIPPQQPDTDIKSPRSFVHSSSSSNLANNSYSVTSVGKLSRSDSQSLTKPSNSRGNTLYVGPSPLKIRQNSASVESLSQFNSRSFSQVARKISMKSSIGNAYASPGIVMEFTDLNLSLPIGMVMNCLRRVDLVLPAPILHIVGSVAGARFVNNTHMACHDVCVGKVSLQTPIVYRKNKCFGGWCHLYAVTGLFTTAVIKLKEYITSINHNTHPPFDKPPEHPIAPESLFSAVQLSLISSTTNQQQMTRTSTSKTDDDESGGYAKFLQVLVNALNSARSGQGNSISTRRSNQVNDRKSISGRPNLSSIQVNALRGAMLSGYYSYFKNYTVDDFTSITKLPSYGDVYADLKKIISFHYDVILATPLYYTLLNDLMNEPIETFILEGIRFINTNPIRQDILTRKVDYEAEMAKRRLVGGVGGQCTQRRNYPPGQNITR